VTGLSTPNQQQKNMEVARCNRASWGVATNSGELQF